MLCMKPTSVMLLVTLLFSLAGCAVAPIAAPTPQPAPPRPAPYPTFVPTRWMSSSDAQTTFRLPGKAYQLDLAVHPTENWPAVGIMQAFNLSTDPLRMYVRVFNPLTRRWGVAQQVDVGESSAGTDRFGQIVVGITGDRTVHAAWGGDDTRGGLWMSRSTDFGTTWSRPRRLAEHCWFPNDLATTPDGQIVVEASCYTRTGSGTPMPHATLIVRRADGTWEPPVQLDVPGWFGSVLIAGDGPDALATAFITAHGAGQDTQIIYLVSKYLRNPGGWEVRARRVAPPGIPASAVGDYQLNIRGLAFTFVRPNAPPRTGLIFVWHGQYRASAYALTTFDGDRGWSAVQPIVWSPGHEDETGRYLRFVAPAFDPLANRLVALTVCCGDANEGQPATHVASWSVPDRGRWYPAGVGGRAPAVPLITGARSAGPTVSDQALNTNVTWLAWIDALQDVTVRSREREAGRVSHR